MRRIKSIREGVVLLAVSMILAVGCDNTPSSQTDESDNPSIESFQKAFESKTFAEVIPYDFKVNWEDSREGYSEVLESTYYEFSLDWTTDFNPDALADRHPHRATYKLIVVPGEELTFYLLQFLEPGKRKTQDLSWTDTGTFTGRVSLFDEAGEKVLATIYTEGDVTDFIPEETKDEFEMWDNNGGKTDTDEMQLVCVTVTTHHCTDWYRVYSDGSREYTGRTCSGSTSSRVCSSGGAGGSGGDGGSTGGGGGGSGGGSSGGGGAPCGDPVHGCFEMEVKDKVINLNNLSLDNDHLTAIDPDTTDISCNNTSDLEEWEEAWCKSSVPKGEDLSKTYTALDNIEQHGPACAEIAQKGRQLLNEYGLRFYPGDNFSFGGKGHSSFGVLLDETWVDYFSSSNAEVIDVDGTTVKLNFEYALIHEIEHAMGRGHITTSNGSRSEWRTPNAVQCSGL